MINVIPILKKRKEKRPGYIFVYAISSENLYIYCYNIAELNLLKGFIYCALEQSAAV